MELGHRKVLLRTVNVVVTIIFLLPVQGRVAESSPCSLFCFHGALSQVESIHLLNYILLLFCNTYFLISFFFLTQLNYSYNI